MRDYISKDNKMIQKNRLRGWLTNWVIYVVSFIPRKATTHYDLVIVRTDALGDYVIWHDSLSAYKKQFVGKRVLLICADLVCPLAEQEPFFSDVLSFSRGRFGHNLRYCIKIIWSIKKISADNVLYPIWQRHPSGDAFVVSIKSPRKVGMLSHSKRISTKFFDRHYTELVYFFSSESEIKAVEYFTQKAVLPNYKYGYNVFELKPHHQELEQDYVVIAFSASTESKSWELEKYAQVIDAIPPRYKVVLTGAGQNDELKAERLVQFTSDKSRVFNLVNKTSVVDLVSLITHSELVIGNDSAAVHIAAATRVKSICVLLGAHFGRFLPYPEDLPFKDYLPITIYSQMPCYGCNYNCIFENQTPYECIKNISAGAVIKEMMKILE